MIFSVIKTHSETYRQIFYFEIRPNGKIFPLEISESHRDDENDVWGDLWYKHYLNKVEEIHEKIRELNDGILFGGGSISSDEHEELEEELKKYNPVLNKTKNGFSRLTSSTVQNKFFQPPDFQGFDKEFVKEEAIKHLTKLIKENN